MIDRQTCQGKTAQQETDDSMVALCVVVGVVLAVLIGAGFYVAY